MNDKLDEFVNMLMEGIKYGQEAVDRLPISVPSPIRDIFFTTLMNKYLELSNPKEHQARRCERCLSVAYQWALYSLGWDDRKTPRPPTAKERMAMLAEQLEEALTVLQTYGRHP